MFPALLLNFALAVVAFQTYTILGSVRDQSGKPVGGIRVSVIDESFQSVRNVFVDSSGHFTVRGLVAGRYVFRIETTGTNFEELSLPIELAAVHLRGGTVETMPIDFILKPKKSREAMPSNVVVFVQDVPGPAKAQYERATNYLKSGDSPQAITALKKSLESFPDYFDALELLGTEYVRGGEFELALPLLAKALEVNQRAPRSLYAEGVALLKLNRPAEAIAPLRTSAEISPNNANTQMMLGLAYRLLPDFKQAEGAFRRALQIGGPAMSEARFYLAVMYERQSRYSEAARELELFLKEDREISNPAQIRSAIEKLRLKAKESPKP